MRIAIAPLLLNSWRQAHKVWALADRAGVRRVADFERLRERFYGMFWQEAAQAAGAAIEGLGDGYFRITRASRETFVHLSEVMLDDHLTLQIAGNKPLTHRLLGERNIPTPSYRRYDLSTLGAAYGFMDECSSASVVVKPCRATGGGRGVTTGVASRHDLLRASIRAAAADCQLLVEEEVDGASFRLLYLDGRLIDAVRRDAPSVTGDGVRAIRELAERENCARLAAQPIRALSPLTIDLDCELYLSRQRLDPRDVLTAGLSVQLKKVVNQNTAADNHRVLDAIDPSIVELGREIVAILDVELAGVDIIAPHLAAPLRETGGVVNEINTTPGLHHHVLVADGARHVSVGQELLEYLFRQGARRMFAATGVDAPVAGGRN